MFALNSKYKLKGELQVVILSLPDLVVFRDMQSGKHCSFALNDAHQLYLESVLEPLEPETIMSDAEINLQFCFFKVSQKRELKLKLALVNAFLGQGITCGLEARELIECICKEHSCDKIYAESTVRNYVTKYLDNNYNPLVLLDHRSNIPFVN